MLQTINCWVLSKEKHSICGKIYYIKPEPIFPGGEIIIDGFPDWTLIWQEAARFSSKEEAKQELSQITYGFVPELLDRIDPKYDPMWEWYPQQKGVIYAHIVEAYVSYDRKSDHRPVDHNHAKKAGWLAYNLHEEGDFVVFDSINAWGQEIQSRFYKDNVTEVREYTPKSE